MRVVSRRAVFVSAAPILLILSLMTFLAAYFNLFDGGPLQAETELSGRALTFLPDADASVMSESHSENYGQSEILRVDGSPVDEAYLKFDLDGLQGLNIHARLRLHVIDESTHGGSVAVNSGAVWEEDSITYEKRPSGEHVTIATLGAVEEDQWYEVNVTPGISGDGPVTFVITSANTDGVEYSSRETAESPELLIEILPDDPVAERSAREDAVTVIAAGDIACHPSDGDFNDGEGTEERCRQQHTADLVVQHDPEAVLMVGDAQYEDGELEAFMGSYDRSWGAFYDKTYPVPGNHEYETDGAAGYFDYFGDRAGDPDEGYYTFDLNGWQFLALNSNCEDIGGCGHDSTQYEWLQQTLESGTGMCEIAFLHHPRWVSAKDLVNDELRPLYDLLYHYGVDLVLSGDSHHYERFRPQDPAGNRDDVAGIRQFVVGMGGVDLHNLETILPNSEVRNNDTFGVLKLVLHDEWYAWEFVAEDGKRFLDTGSGACR